MNLNQPSKTANGQYEYSQLDELIQGAHKEMSEDQKWEYKKLIPGMFGYDNMACSIGKALSDINEKKIRDLEEISNSIHEGWIINYIYWRDNSPFEKDKRYKRPFKPIGDETRNKLAITSYKDLPETEKHKDRIIASYLIKNLKF